MSIMGEIYSRCFVNEQSARPGERLTVQHIGFLVGIATCVLLCEIVLNILQAPEVSAPLLMADGHRI